MLNTHFISSTTDKQGLLKSFDPLKETWIVSDLKSKFNLQNSLLKQHGFLEEDCVLRVSELWRRLLIQFLPEFQVISADLARILIAHYLKDSGYNKANAHKISELIFQYIQQLMPVLTHPEGDDILEAWFIDNPSAAQRWQSWYELSVKIWSYFLMRKLTPQQWICGQLINEIGFEQCWERKIVLDLGPELTQVEADLFANLSRSTDLDVLFPLPDSFSDEVVRALKPYETFAINFKKIAPPLANDRKPTEINCSQLSSMLAEVKHTVSQLRTLIDEGVKASSLLISAPDIENYWPTLLSYLKIEGIPINKDVTTRYIDIPIISSWLSSLRLHAHEIDSADLEIDLFSNTKKPMISYEQFAQLYSVIYDQSDLARDPQIASQYQMQISRGPVKRDHFIKWSIQLWPAPDSLQEMVEVFKSILAECPESISLETNDWIRFLEKVLCKKDLIIENGNPFGINCLNNTSAEFTPATHHFFLGMSEELLKTSLTTQILYRDVLSLSQNTGFNLSLPENRTQEFDVKWLILNSEKIFHLLTPASDFEGKPLTPSLIWMNYKNEDSSHLEIISPDKSRWDELQSNHITFPTGSNQLQSAIPNSISATKIEDYLTCPFIYAAKNIFFLSDLPSVDLDTDHMTTGRLLHKLMEELGQLQFKVEDMENSLSELLEKNKKDLNIILADEKLWFALKRRYMNIAKRVINFEQTWRKNFPKTKTLAVEYRLKSYIDIETGKFAADPGNNSIPFNAMIDRIDSDGHNQVVIIDYKSSLFGLSQVNKWLDNNILQLLLYSAALEQTTLDGSKINVAGAFFYIPKKIHRTYGFRLETHPESLYSLASREKNILSPTEKDFIMNQTTELIKNTLQKMSNGDIFPNPNKSTECNSCPWQKICRAPHLN